MNRQPDCNAVDRVDRRRALTLAMVGGIGGLLPSDPADAADKAGTSIDLDDYRRRTVGKPTQILILGTPHLSAAGPGFRPEHLEPLLARLAAFRPNAIGIEGLSGESLFALQTYGSVFPNTAQDYGRRVFAIAAIAKATLNLDMPQAEAAVRQALRTPPARPAERRRLAALFAASGDPNSALVQWWRLDLAERRPGDGVSVALIEVLDAFAARANENHLVSARLASRIGLERVYPIDDHAADDLFPDMIGQLEAYLKERRIGEHPFIVRHGQRLRGMTSASAVLAAYRDVNSPAFLREDAASQWIPLLDRPVPAHAGRRRMAEWDIRNLRILGHIRKASAAIPGGRMLVTIGFSHKAWLELLVGRLTPDIEVVDAQTILT